MCSSIVAGLGKLSPDQLVNLVVYYGDELPHEFQLREMSKLTNLTALRRHKIDVLAEFGVLGLPAAIAIDEKWRIEAYHYPSSAGDLSVYFSLNDELHTHVALQSS